MLIGSILLYLALTVGIGVYAAKRVRGSRDFLVAGRSLPLGINFATVFAAWFGAQTVLSVSATFTGEGLRGVPGDPFGASFALFFFAIFFARAFYRMDLLTIGDFYRRRYGKLVEVVTSLTITVSYVGWIAAQLTALGLVLHVSSGGAWPLDWCILAGALVVTGYTLLGGMWAVALTNVLQTLVIVVGLLLVAWLVGDMAGGPANVIAHAHAAGRLDLWPEGGLVEWLPFVAAWMTMALGSLPRQDMFQRVTSATDEKTAVRGSLLGGAAYLAFAFVPMFIAYAAVVIDPKLLDLFGSGDSREVQRILPDLILARTPLWAQVMFFGALLSAILSSASGALLAPTALFTENVLRPFMPEMSDRRFLALLRAVLVLFTSAALLFALNSRSTLSEMVQNAFEVTLVGALVPLAAGLFWKRATAQGALLSVFMGLVVWGAGELNHASALVPPQLAGLVAAIVGMVAGSLLPQLVTARDTA
ncbi:sodium:solute symporter family protein [Quisquiliibacterium transsilvanicum]|uniref:Na+/proline symporter n=1 Tax=Quisquiliibacterium transsilvanicum TaxID=1549638 RepID=A0A7W8HJH4_9BURK|nr:sodium:solute symporter family protein [Quisquiliibacterium transsilvanicum]MBB5273214.1 Na+/proline symporter [Quisquiliibacterium transsilvanicum]